MFTETREQPLKFESPLGFTFSFFEVSAIGEDGREVEREIILPYGEFRKIPTQADKENIIKFFNFKEIKDIKFLRNKRFYCKLDMSEVVRLSKEKGSDLFKEITYFDKKEIQ